MTDVKAMEEKQNFWLMPENKMIKIIHMPKLWSEQPDLKLIPSSRFVGRDEDFDVEEAITAFNFDTTKYQIYQNLVDQYNEWIKDTLKTAIKAPGHKLTSELPAGIEDEKVEEVIEELQETLMDSVMDETVPIKQITKTVKRPKKPVNLQLKINKLDHNKIIDVSNMNEYGVGIKTVIYNESKHADKYFLRNKALMSDNYKSLINALHLVKGGPEKYIKDIRKAEKFFKISDPYVEKKTPEKGKKSKISKYDKYKPTDDDDNDSDDESEPEMEPEPKKRTPKTKKVSESEESEPEMEPEPKKRTPKSKKVTEESESESEPEMEPEPKKRTPKSKKVSKFEPEPKKKRTKKVSESEEEKPKKNRTPKSKKVSESEEEKPKKKPKKSKKVSESEEEPKNKPKKSKKISESEEKPKKKLKKSKKGK